MSFIPIPYGFSPINPLHSIHDTPLWRDGSSKEPRFSGELLITLTALTPLIVGNHQQELDKKHSFLVPQMLDDGRVLIGAASLKGMLRSALVSLLQAPMDRVTEHHYTYRPNLGFGPKNGANRREQRAAIIKEVKGEGPAATVTIDLLPSDCPVVFIRNLAQQRLGQPVAGEHIQCTISGVTLNKEKATRMRLETAGNSSGKTPLDHYFFLYHGGIDGDGHLARAFKSNSHVYHAVLVPTPEYKKATTMCVPEKVLTAYYRTQEILADDKYGHLSPGYPNLKNLQNVDNTQRSICKHAHLQINQLIYVEIETGKTSPDKAGINITSMGHHFQYRWGYSSSVCYENRLLDGKGKLRAELALRPEEHADKQGAPQRLTSGRLLFGYAVDDRDDMQAGLAQNNFKRLAGRITFNTAIEYHENKTLAERFMEGGKEIQLHVLGMPRPSAVEFYLKQATLPKQLTTYGDLPGDPGGNLAGRKFYRHQPDAREQAQRYSSNERQNNANTEERGTCVRYLSRPGSRFRCTLRFDSLRPWELGVLLTALNPKLLESTFELPNHPRGYAHKLGYGKPLGLGSVRLKIDAARWQANDDWIWQQSQTNETAWQNLQTSSLAALKDKLLTAWQDTEASKSHLTSWLKARAWADSGFAAYPTKADKDDKKTIFNYHTNLRRDHAAVRRGDTHKCFNELKKLLESGI